VYPYVAAYISTVAMQIEKRKHLDLPLLFSFLPCLLLSLWEEGARR
jgi:hypothetical protein